MKQCNTHIFKHKCISSPYLLGLVMLTWPNAKIPLRDVGYQIDAPLACYENTAREITVEQAIGKGQYSQAESAAIICKPQG